MAWTVRRFQKEDAQAVSKLIIRTLREINIRDYTQEYIESTAAQMKPEDIARRASWTHFYVALDGEKIIGCGAIGPYWEKEDESCFFTIFTLPEYQGQGVGRKIIETLEADEYFLCAKRVEIPASITACGFYRKFGYDYKDGRSEPDEEGLIRLEKYRSTGFGGENI